MKPRAILRVTGYTLLVIFFSAIGSAVIAYACADTYGVNSLMRRGGTKWVNATNEDDRLSPSMKTALTANPPTPTAGGITWKEAANGLETAELPALADGKEVDRILLTRIDPKKFRIRVHNAPAGDKELGDWVKSLGAAFVINGSYYDRVGKPDTPFLSNGQPSGPAEYSANHGALVIKDESASVVDLRNQAWQTAFNGAHDALVSYPLLLAPDDTTGVKASRWLANRSFVASDKNGRLVFGTTKDAFFSLHALSLFLKNAPLDLTMVLNLDGGPVACQAVMTPNYQRDFCGMWELQENGNTLKLLQPNFGSRRWALPIVISATAVK